MENVHPVGSSTKLVLVAGALHVAVFFRRWGAGGSNGITTIALSPILDSSIRKAEIVAELNTLQLAHVARGNVLAWEHSRLYALKGYV